MPGFGVLVDTFEDGVIDPVLWPESYGAVTETGGRARVPCTTGYSGYRSAAAYTLAWSQFSVRVYPPAAGGGTLAGCSILVLSDVGGTDAGFFIDAAQNAVGLYSRVGYGDPAAVFLTYDPAAHAWVRLRHDGTSLLWETGPDGLTWTTRRTSPAPAWIADATLSLLLEAHRDAGTDDYAEFDNLNVSGRGRLTAAARSTGRLSPLARTGPTLKGG